MFTSMSMSLVNTTPTITTTTNITTTIISTSMGSVESSPR